MPFIPLFSVSRLIKILKLNWLQLNILNLNFSSTFRPCHTSTIKSRTTKTTATISLTPIMLLITSMLKQVISRMLILVKLITAVTELMEAVMRHMYSIQTTITTKIITSTLHSMHLLTVTPTNLVVAGATAIIGVAVLITGIGDNRKAM
jgi:hypothetical protein